MGDELFYFTTTGRSFMSVSIKPSGTSLNVAAPVLALLHPAPRPPFSSYFSVTKDRRFLLQLAASAPASGGGVNPATAATLPGATTAPNTITIILNWAAGRRP
jgi:hypothetical protein